MTASALAPVSLIERYRIDLEHIERVDGYTALIPLDELPTLRLQAETMLVPASRRQIAKAVATLFASFKLPEGMIQDPDAFTRAMIAELCGYPSDILETAVRQARRTLKWLPAISEMIEIADRLVSLRERMLHNIDAMSREHDRRRREAERRAEVEADRRWYLEREEALMREWCREHPDEIPFETPAEVRAALHAERRTKVAIGQVEGRAPDALH